MMSFRKNENFSDRPIRFEARKRSFYIMILHAYALTSHKYFIIIRIEMQIYVLELAIIY
jgi:hypothetical protein